MTYDKLKDPRHEEPVAEDPGIPPEPWITQWYCQPPEPGQRFRARSRWRRDKSGCPGIRRIYNWEPVDPDDKSKGPGDIINVRQVSGPSS